MSRVYQYLSSTGAVTRTVHGLVSDSEADAGLHPSESGWRLVESGESMTQVPEPVRSLRLRQLAAHRYAVETGGTALTDGTQILTGRTDQTMTTQALLKLERMPSGSLISFKSPSGFVDLDLAELRAVWAAGSDHVQRCFAAEGVVAGQIAALPDADLNSFDVRAAFAAAFENL